MSWMLEWSGFPRSKAKSIGKNHPEEMKQMLDNLEHYLMGLSSGLNPLTYHPGFLHKESCGVKAIDAKGMRKPAQTRLYVYPEPRRKLLHVIAVGDKHSQKRDNVDCCKYVADLQEDANAQSK